MPTLRLFGQLLKTTWKLYFIGVASLLFCAGVYAEAPLSKEKKLKAAYLLNFTKFIEWPDTTKIKSTSTIRICVDASSEFQQFLSQLVGDRRVGRLNNKVAVMSLFTATGCELLYIQGKQNSDSLQFKNTVIVADSDNISFSNAAIFFYTEDRKLRFEIDLEKINTLNVAVSSELLKLARIK